MKIHIFQIPKSTQFSSIFLLQILLMHHFSSSYVLTCTSGRKWRITWTVRPPHLESWYMFISIIIYHVPHWFGNYDKLTQKRSSFLMFLPTCGRNTICVYSLLSLLSSCFLSLPFPLFYSSLPFFQLKIKKEESGIQ